MVEGRRHTDAGSNRRRPGLAAFIAALSRLDDESIDRGRWNVEVDVPGGRTSLTLSTPQTPLPREVVAVAERLGGGAINEVRDQVREVLEDRLRPGLISSPGRKVADDVASMSPDDVIEALDATARSSRERAEALWARSAFAWGRAQRRLAEGAVEESAECVGGWVIQALHAPTAEESIFSLRRAIDAGRSLQAAAARPEEIPIAARHASEAAIVLAEKLHAAGAAEEGIEILKSAVAEGSPSVLVRLVYASWRLRAGDARGAIEVLDSGSLHPFPFLCWLRALASYVLSGDTPTVRTHVTLAVAIDPVTGACLVRPSLVDDPQFARLAGDAPGPTLAHTRKILEELGDVLATRPSFRTLVRDALESQETEPEARPPTRRFKLRRPRSR